MDLLEMFGLWLWSTAVALFFLWVMFVVGVSFSVWAFLPSPSDWNGVVRMLWGVLSAFVMFLMGCAVISDDD